MLGIVDDFILVVVHAALNVKVNILSIVVQTLLLETRSQFIRESRVSYLKYYVELKLHLMYKNLFF